MKIVKRVSLYRAVERINTPYGYSPKIEHASYQQIAPWKMPMDMELFKYGYRNKPRLLSMAVLSVAAVLLGLTAYCAEMELRNVHMG